MIEFIPLSDSDFTAWNNFVLDHDQSQVYHLAEWSVIYKEVYSFKSHYHFILDDHKITGLLPIIHVKGLFKNFLITPPSGILLGDKSRYQEKIIEFLFQLKTRVNAKDIELINFPEAIPGFYKRDDNIRIIKLLPGTVDALWQDIGGNRRNMVRKAEKNGLSNIIIQPLPSDVPVFYSIYSENYRDLGTPVHKEEFFIRQIEYIAKYIRINIVKQNGITIGISWFHHFRDHMSGENSASLRKYFYTGVNDFKLYKEFEYAVINQCKYFDIGRGQKGSSNLPFKTSWGDGKIIDFPSISLTQLPSISENKARYKFILDIWKRSPLLFTNMMGPWIRKNIRIE